MRAGRIRTHTPCANRAQHVRLKLKGRIANLRDLVSLFQTLQHAFDTMYRVEKETAQRIRCRANPWLAARLIRFACKARFGRASPSAAALLIPASLGWSTNTLVAPIAFMVAAIPTRGGVTQMLVALAVVLSLGWLFADLAIVFISPVLGRLPLALVHVAAVAGTLAYLTAKWPKLEALRTLGGLLALLTVYGGPVGSNGCLRSVRHGLLLHASPGRRLGNDAHVLARHGRDALSQTRGSPTRALPCGAPKFDAQC